MRFAGKVALVTGATGGLGRAIATELAREGASIAIHYLRRRQEAEELAGEIEALGRRVSVVSGDVVDASQVSAMIRQVVDDLGGLDIVVNNAGVVDFSASWDSYDDTMAVNVKGPLVVSLAAQRHLRSRRGVIVMISSGSAYGARGPYTVSKAALNALTRCLAQDFAPEVRVVGVAPGFVEAGMNERRREVWERVAAHSPLQRNGTPWDVARAVAYLASEDAAWVTGETINVNGGSLMRA